MEARVQSDGGAPPALTPAQLLVLYRAMVRIRIVDERMTTLQRSGRVGFYGTSTGQEAACLGAAFALRASDWIFPALREGAAMLLRGAPLVAYLAQVFGNSGDPSRGRQMPNHQSDARVKQASWSSCIGTQLPHAVGVAWAARLKKEDTVVLAYLGDGATSTSDFHAAMNFAGVSAAPVVFLCQNNGWSISLPAKRQSAAAGLHLKAAGYGIPGVQVDGNDLQAVYAMTAQAVERARRGEGPTLIEALTYRMGPHSTSDDPSRYQDPAELLAWRARDPIDRLRAVLVAGGGWTEAHDAELRTELRSEVDAAIAVAEKLPPPDPETLFEDVYARLPWHLREQRDTLLQALSSPSSGAGAPHGG